MQFDMFFTFKFDFKLKIKLYKTISNCKNYYGNT